MLIKHALVAGTMQLESIELTARKPVRHLSFLIQRFRCAVDPGVRRTDYGELGRDRERVGRGTFSNK